MVVEREILEIIIFCSLENHCVGYIFYF